MNITIISPSDIAHPYISNRQINEVMPQHKGTIPPNKDTGQMGFLRKNIEVLKRLYYEEKLTQRELAQRIGVHQNQVSKIMQEFKLKPRDGIERAMLLRKRGVYDALRKQVVFKCNFCGQESSMPISQWRRSKKHYCSEICRLKVLEQARGKATIIGKQQEEKWLNQQPDREHLFRCSELPDFMRVTASSIEFFEIKSHRFHVRANQKETIRRLKELGFHVEVVVMPN